MLDLISSLVTPETTSISSQALELCGSYSMSQDARVRTAAFHGLLTIHKRGVKLDVSMYNVFVQALTDDYEAELQRRFFADFWGGPLILDP